MRVVTVNRPDRKLTKNKKYSEITPPKLGCQFEIQKFWIYYSILYIYIHIPYWVQLFRPSPLHRPLWSLRPRYLTHGWLWWFPMYHSYNLGRFESECSNWLGINQDSMVGIGIFKMLSKWCLANGKYMKMWICHSDFPYQLSCPSQDPRPMERKSIIRAIPCEVRETPRFCSRRLEVMFRCLLAGIWRSLWHLKSPNVVEKTSIFGILKGSPSNTQSTFWGWSGWSVTSQEFDFMEKKQDFNPKCCYSEALKRQKSFCLWTTVSTSWYG